MLLKKLLTILFALFALFGCADSAQTKRNKFDACVINEMSGYWDVRTVSEYVPGNPNGIPGCKSETGLGCIDFGKNVLVEREVFVKPTQNEAKASCVYLLE